MEEKTQNKISVPLAIIVAGGLIALAVFMTGANGDSKPATNTNPENPVVVSNAVPMQPITPEDKILGNPNAEIVIVEFSDLECPFCKTIHNTLHDIMDTYGKDGKVAWVFKHFPLEQLHSKAPQEHLAVECATNLGGNDTGWDFIDRIFVITPANNGLDLAKLPQIAVEVGLDKDKFNACMTSGSLMSVVEAEYEEAIAAGGSGTPFSVFVVKNALSNSQVTAVETIARELPDGLIGISDDKKKVTMSGALPYTLIERIIKAIE